MVRLGIPHDRSTAMLIWAVLAAVGIGVVAGISYFSLFAAPTATASPGQFTVPLGDAVSDSRELAALLAEDGFVKSAFGFHVAFMGLSGIFGTCVDCFQSGAYKLSRDMTAFEVAATLKSGPHMKWVVIPEGFRKEQIAARLQTVLAWSDAEEKRFVTQDTETSEHLSEGVYFPDTYLISVSASTTAVAERFRTHFDEVFAPYAEEALAQNIRWPTLITIASLVQREAAGDADMPLIAGILWNRLLQDMRLQVDATVQYARDTVMNYEMYGGDCTPDAGGVCRNEDWKRTYFGNTREEYAWWQPIESDDTDIPLAFNTYRYTGLPPRPIANPGTAAIEAVLYPAETDCLFYLHEDDGTVHCSETYAEHQEKIEQYLQ